MQRVYSKATIPLKPVLITLMVALVLGASCPVLTYFSAVFSIELTSSKQHRSPATFSLNTQTTCSAYPEELPVAFTASLEQVHGDARFVYQVSSFSTLNHSKRESWNSASGQQHRIQSSRPLFAQKQSLQL